MPLVSTDFCKCVLNIPSDKTFRSGQWEFRELPIDTLPPGNLDDTFKNESPVIGDSLTEINVTSPSCFQAIPHQNGFGAPARFIDALEATLT